MIKNINWKRWYILIFVFYAFVGLFNSFIANNKPIIASKDGSLFFPALHDFLHDFGLASEAKIYNENVFFDWQIDPLVKYSAVQPDVNNPGFKAPSSTHIFGTDLIGRDTLAGVIRGCYTSFRIGIFGTLICGFLGIFLGIASGYFEDNGIKLNIIQFLLILIVFFLLIFYLVFPVGDFKFYGLIIIGISISLIYLIAKYGNKLNLKRYNLPLDSIINKIIELRKSIPTLIILLACLPLFSKPSINNVIILIAILGWSNFARHARAETLSIKQREFVLSSKIMGGSFFHILRLHILPNISTTLIVLAVSSFTTNILLESTLSFLSIGLPPTEVSWGSMIAESRKHLNAWWLFVFPGLALMILVFSLNYYSTKYLSDKE